MYWGIGTLIILVMAALLTIAAAIPLPQSLALLDTSHSLLLPCFLVVITTALILFQQRISLRLIGRMIADFSLWVLSDGANPFIIHSGTVSITAFCLGLTILAIISSIVCGLAFKGIWRYKTVSSWQKRQRLPTDKPPKP